MHEGPRTEFLALPRAGEHAPVRDPVPAVITRMRAREDDELPVRFRQAGTLHRVPAVGERILLSVGKSRWLATSPIQRLMSTRDGLTLYAETANSVYRLALVSSAERLVALGGG